MDFDRWKQLPPVVHLAKSLSFDTELSLCVDWNDYKTRFVAANGDDGHLIAAAKTLSLKLSTSEISVLAAMLHAGDFSYVADQIDDTGPWQRFGRIHGDYADAVAFAIMRA